MSHFTLLVIGDDIEGQLAPYDENISVAPYRSYWDEGDVEMWRGILTKEDQTLDVSTLEKLVVAYNANYGEEDDSEEKLCIETKEDALPRIRELYAAGGMSPEKMEEETAKALDHCRIYTMSTYNPKSKWDWYQVGGRWRGYFKIKAGISSHPELLGAPGTGGNPARYDADHVIKGHVDAEGMRDRAGLHAGDRWDRVHSIIDPLTSAFVGWQELLQQVNAEGLTIEEARATYGSQPQVKAIEKHDHLCYEEKRESDVLLGFMGTLDDMMQEREEYVEAARDDALAPYAYLKNGHWVEPGRMGMFGSSSATDESRADYVKQFNKMFDALPDDAQLTLVDCHI